MAGTNDFKAIATGGGANVITQSAFAALTTFLANGYSSGVVHSDQFNKIIRQSSFIASVIGKIISDAELDALDDGDDTTLASNLLSALGSRPGHTYTANDWAWIDKASGLFCQWGYVSMLIPDSANAVVTSAFTFPTSFPNSIFCVCGNPVQGGPFVGTDVTEPGECTFGFNFTGSAPYTGGTIRAMRISGVSAGSSTSFPYLAIGR